MRPKCNKPLLSWEEKQVREYKTLLPAYELFSIVLKDILERISAKYAPFAIVQTRPKSIASFAEKIQRKRALYKNAVRDMTDLCGGRIITHTQEEIRSICVFIEQYFEIDWENSINVSQRLKPAEFGYRSVHYIISFKKRAFPFMGIGVKIPKSLFGLKAEIQVRTLLEHAWADFTHDKTYKNSFRIPEEWQRELAGIAAALEGADKEFSRIDSGVKAYASNYGNYMSREKAQSEMELLEFVLRQDRNNLELADRIAKLAMTIGDWKKAVRVLSPYSKTPCQPILRDLGVSLCKLHKASPKSKGYGRGQRYLEAASLLPEHDADTLASFAGTWKGIDEKAARELYHRAFKLSPRDPYVLGNYLDYEISCTQDTSLLSSVRPLIEEVIQGCRNQAKAGANLPWVYYNLGKFYLLLNRPYDSLSAYAKAITLSNHDWILATALDSLRKLAGVQEKFPAYSWVYRLLVLSSALKMGRTDLLKKEFSGKCTFIKGPVVIVAGGCDRSFTPRLRLYRRIFLEAFRNFKGTIISGGTTAGVSGLVGEIQKKYPHNIHTIGYLPKKIPVGEMVDRRYRQIIMTKGDDFSPLEPLQAWVDLALSGINPVAAKLLGINGEANAAVEYRLALAFGASVAVIKDSGGEAGKLLADRDWVDSRRLLALDADMLLVKSFIDSGNYRLGSSGIREKIARAFHENYRQSKAQESRRSDLAVSSWQELTQDLKEYNFQLSDSIEEKLNFIGCTMNKSDGDKRVFLKFTTQQIENLAELEHGRWVIERLLDNWKFGEAKDTEKKISPYLVSWAGLPEEIKERDRQAVRKIPEFLAGAGLSIYRQRNRNR